MTTEDSRQENIRVGAAVRAAAEAVTEPGWVKVAAVPLAKRRVVLDLVFAKSIVQYARPGDDGPVSSLTGLPVIYLTAEDFRALGEREQITITIEPGDQLNPGHRVPCVDGNVCGDPAHCPPATSHVTVNQFPAFLPGDVVMGTDEAQGGVIVERTSDPTPNGGAR